MPDTPKAAAIGRPMSAIVSLAAFDRHGLVVQGVRWNGDRTHFEAETPAADLTTADLKALRLERQGRSA